MRTKKIKLILMIVFAVFAIASLTTALVVTLPSDKAIVANAELTVSAEGVATSYPMTSEGVAAHKSAFTTSSHGGSHSGAKAITASTATLKAGKYYLSGNVKLTTDLTVTGDVTLCLNGYMLTGTGTGSVITLSDGASLTLVDCCPGAASCSNANHKHAFGFSEYEHFDFSTSGEGILHGGLITGGIGKQVVSNSSLDHWAYGGGIYASANTSITMYGGIIGGNCAQAHYRTTVSSGYRAPYAWAYGGAVYALGSVNIYGGGIVGNSAYGHCSNTDSQWENYIPYGEAFGGGLYLRGDDECVIRNATISHNVAYSKSETPRFTDRWAISFGGGVNSTVPVRLENSHVDYNTARAVGMHWNASNSYYTYGGGMYLEGGGSMVNSTIDHNTSSAYWAMGGGVYINGTFTMESGSISYNKGEATRDGTFVMNGGTVAHNSGENYAIDSAFVMNGGYVENNNASYIINCSSVKISGGEIRYNKGTSVIDGTYTFSTNINEKFYQTYSSNIKITGGKIYGNECTYIADVYNGSIEMTSGEVYDNACTTVFRILGITGTRYTSQGGIGYTWRVEASLTGGTIDSGSGVAVSCTELTNTTIGGNVVIKGTDVVVTGNISNDAKGDTLEIKGGSIQGVVQSKSSSTIIEVTGGRVYGVRATSGIINVSNAALLQGDGTGIGLHGDGGTINMNVSSVSGFEYGVYASSGSVNMSAGAVTRNKIGAYLAGGSFNVSGSIIVDGNDEANVYVPSGAKLKIVDALWPVASIGITMEDRLGVFTSGYSTAASGSNIPLDPTSIFFSDESGLKPLFVSNEVSLGLAHYHDRTDFNPISSGVTKLSGKSSYYLTGNYTSNLTITGTVSLCLNGYALTASGSSAAITVRKGASLTIYDCCEGASCSEGTAHQHAVGDTTVYGGLVTGGSSYIIDASGTLTLVNGTIASSATYGVKVASTGMFHMNGGTIAQSVNGVYVGGGNFVMTAGNVSGSTNGVNIASGLFNVSGGEITNVVSNGTTNISGSAQITSSGTGLTVGNSITTMTGGVIAGETSVTGGIFSLVNATSVDSVTVASGAAFIMNGSTVNTVTNNGTFTMSGGVVTNVNNNDTFTFTRGTVTTVISSGSTTISGSAEIVGTGSGTGLTVNAGTAIIDGGTISGCGIGVNVVDGELFISGNPQINSNTVNVYLASGKKIAVSGDLSGAQVGVTLADEFGVFTTGYATVHNGVVPTKFFSSDEQYKMRLTADNEAELYDGHYHDDELSQFVQLTSGTNLALDNGHYYLEENFKGNIYINGTTVVLCLNGHDLTASGIVVRVYNGGNFTLLDCQDCGHVSGASASGVSVQSNSTFTMGSDLYSGGIISECDRGVQLSGGTFNMVQGTITNNNVGVAFDSGAFQIYGTPVVSGNEQYDAYIAKNMLITIVAPLQTGAVIGVTLGTEDGCGTFTTRYSSFHDEVNPNKFFFSNEDKSVILDLDNEAALYEIGRHEHDDGDVYTELTQGATILESGKYYLRDNFTGKLTITGNVELCLNGYALKAEGEFAIVVRDGAKFTLVDCCEDDCVNSGHQHKYTVGGDGKYVFGSGSDTIKGGVVIGTVLVDGGTFKMEGGTIAGASYGVYINEGKFTMKDGCIQGNITGVYVGGTFTMNGGIIEKNITAVDVARSGQYTLTDGVIRSNRSGVHFRET